MNAPIGKPQSPSFPQVGPGRKYEDVLKSMNALGLYLRQFTGPYLDQILSQIINQLNTQVQSVGPILPSAATIIPTNPVHHVSGVAAIDTISIDPAFSGPIFLIPDGAWTLTTGGNIGKATSAVVGQVMTLVFDYEFWWPSY
jgi:hypothetical protein